MDEMVIRSHLKYCERGGVDSPLKKMRGKRSREDCQESVCGADKKPCLHALMLILEQPACKAPPNARLSQDDVLRHCIRWNRYRV